MAIIKVWFSTALSGDPPKLVPSRVELLKIESNIWIVWKNAKSTLKVLEA